MLLPDGKRCQRDGRPAGAACGLARTRFGCGYNTRTVQEIPGHTDVRPTMIYAHVLNRVAGSVGVDFFKAIGGLLRYSGAPSIFHQSPARIMRAREYST